MIDPLKYLYFSLNSTKYDGFYYPVESAKLAEAAAAAEAVEIHRKTLESKSFINDEKIDSLDERIITAQGIALISTRNHEEAGRCVCSASFTFKRENTRA